MRFNIGESCYYVFLSTNLNILKALSTVLGYLDEGDVSISIAGTGTPQKVKEIYLLKNPHSPEEFDAIKKSLLLDALNTPIKHTIVEHDSLNVKSYPRFLPYEEVYLIFNTDIAQRKIVKTRIISLKYSSLTKEWVYIMGSYGSLIAEKDIFKTEEEALEHLAFLYKKIIFGKINKLQNSSTNFNTVKEIKL